MIMIAFSSPFFLFCFVFKLFTYVCFPVGYLAELGSTHYNDVCMHLRLPNCNAVRIIDNSA